MAYDFSGRATNEAQKIAGVTRARRPQLSFGPAGNVTHAIDAVTGQMGTDPKNDPAKDYKNWPNRVEERAGAFENAVRNGAGLNRRESYYDALR